MRDLDDFNKLEERAWQLEKELEARASSDEDIEELQYEHDEGKYDGQT